MKKLQLLSVLVVACLSVVPVSAQDVYTFGMTREALGKQIAFKADASPVTPAILGTAVNFMCGNTPGTTTGNCLPASKYAVTAVDDVTGQPATWVKLGRATSWAVIHPPLPAGSTSTFTAQLNQPNTIVAQVDKNGGAARSATFKVTVNGLVVPTQALPGPPPVPSPTIKITQAGQ